MSNKKSRFSNTSLNRSTQCWGSTSWLGSSSLPIWKSPCQVCSLVGRSGCCISKTWRVRCWTIDWTGRRNLTRTDIGITRWHIRCTRPMLKSQRGLRPSLRRRSTHWRYKRWLWSIRCRTQSLWKSKLWIHLVPSQHSWSKACSRGRLTLLNQRLRVLRIGVRRRCNNNS